MDGQELASYYIDSFLYKDGDKYKEATVLETKKKMEQHIRPKSVSQYPD